MNAYLQKYLVPLSCSGVACLLAACATTRTDSLRASASRLDDASSHFSSQIQYQGSDSRYQTNDSRYQSDSRRGPISRDAEALAQAAHDFNRAVDQRDSHDSVQADYRRVTDDYEQLHSRLADAGYADQNRQVLQDFDRVTNAYRDVEAGMSRQ
jgi:hypothetical protein